VTVENPFGLTGLVGQSINLPETPASPVGTGATGGTYNFDEDPETKRLRLQQEFEKNQLAAQLKAQQDWDAAQKRREQDQAISSIQAIFKTYGLDSLYDTIVDYARKDYSADTIAIMLRETPQYKARFPAMASLSSKNRAISEGQYIEFETLAAGLERRNGFPPGMLTGNVTKLLENEVSIDELNNRVTLATAASIQAPQDLKDTLSQYYNVGAGGLAAYFLDPSVATPLLEKQYASAQIGAEAARQNIGIDVGIAQNLQELGVTQAQAQEGFGRVAGQSSFLGGAGDVVDQNTLIQGNLAGNAAAIKDIERVAGSRRGRFEGGGSFEADKSGNIGLKSAATR
jgi:hypothetical protein